MTTWLFRGLVLGAIMVLARLLQGTLVNMAGTNSGLLSLLIMAAMIIPAFLWGLLDGRADAKASPDPDRRKDLAMRWILAGVVAGAASGLACWIIGKMTVKMYAGNIFAEVTTIAAFTALLFFLPAIIAVSIGRWLVDRNNPYQGRRREEGESSIFDKVRRDDDFIDAERDSRIAPAVLAADYPETFTHTENYPYNVKVDTIKLAEVEESEGATEEITRQIQEQAARIESEIDDIGGKKA